MKISNNLFLGGGGVKTINVSSRNIPEPIKRSIRQRCGFGCVVCGSPIYHYDHLLNDWADVKTHIESDITLLCPTHHMEKTNGLLTRSQVKKFDARPYNIEQGVSSPFQLNFEGKDAKFEIATNLFTHDPLRGNLLIPVSIDGIPMLGFLIEHNRLLLRFSVYDDYNNEIFTIFDNQLQFLPDNWDVKIVGNRLKVLEGSRKILLDLEFFPPNRIVIREIKIRFNGVIFQIKRDYYIVNGQKTSFASNYFPCPVGIGIGANRFGLPDAAFRIPNVNRYKH